MLDERREQRGRLSVVGVGPADGYLTASAARLIRCSEVFAGGEAALRAAPAWGRTIPIGGDLSVVLDRIEESLAAGHDVCALTSGDPGYFGLLAALERRFPGESVVEPSVSSMQLLAARVGLPWHELSHVSVHGRRIASIIGAGGPLAVLCGGENTPAAVARRLLEIHASMVAAVGVSLGGLEETIMVASLETVAAEEFGAPAVLIAAPRAWLAERGYTMVVRPRSDSVPGCGPPPVSRFAGVGLTVTVGDAGRRVFSAPGIPDEEFERPDGVPLSRWEVRSVLATIAKPKERRVIWDVGAGSGGFAVEMGLLAPDARVVAFERDARGCDAVRRNAARFGARVEVRKGEAPGVLEELGAIEPPDLIIVGGSGGRLEDILRLVARWLAPGGRVVVTAVTLETAGTAARMLSSGPWAGHEALQLTTARLDRAGIMKGANPTTLLWADKQAVTTEPVTTEPVAAEPVAAEPVTTEPASSRATLSPASSRGVLWALGLGPGDPGLVTVRASEILRTTPVVAFPVDAKGDPGRAFQIAQSYLAPGVMMLPLEMPMTNDQARLDAAWELAIAAISERTAAGFDVAYVCLGDSLLYGSFGYLLARYDGPVEVIPGVISPVAAAAALRVPLVEGREPLTVIPDGGDSTVLAHALELGGSIVVMKPSRLDQKGAEVLNEAGAVDRAWVAEDVSLPTQRVYSVASVEALTELPYFSVVTVLAPGRAKDDRKDGVDR